MTVSGESYIEAAWSTLVKDYKDYNGIQRASYGEAHWSLPQGDFCYGRIHIKEVKYNLESFE